jgi:hypothetical protein
MAFAALAILGQRSAHSLPIGPVMADPAREAIVSSSHAMPNSIRQM